MDKPISKGLQTTFLIHGIFSAILGLALWLIPGRTLTLLLWVPSVVGVAGTDLTTPGTFFVDAILTRVLGAILLALAFSSFQGWRSEEWGKVELLVQLEIIACVLSVIAFLAGLILHPASFNLTRWLFLLILAAFAVAWIVAYWRHQSAPAGSAES